MTRQRSGNRAFVSAWLITAILSTVRVASADVAADVRAFTEAPTRLVWVSQEGNEQDIYAFDTEDGKSVRRLVPNVRSYAKPIFTPDGLRVVYYSRAENASYVVNWDGTGNRKLVGGFASDVWRDPKTGIEWLYVRSGDGRHTNPLLRYRMDDLTVVETVWTKTAVGHEQVPWFELSQDGTRAADAFPWGACGVATLVGEPTWKKYTDGCWPSISPDNSYRAFVFNGDHRNVSMYDADGRNPRTVRINDAPGINGAKVYYPRWSNHPRFMTMTGPGIAEPSGELYIGKFNAEFTAVERWVRVTYNNQSDMEGDAWIDPGRLGQHRGESPFTVDFAYEAATGTWDWDFGDGKSAKSPSAKHTYTAPGRYTVEARSGNETLRGFVQVEPPKPPQPVHAAVRDGKEIVLLFDESVELRKPSLRMRSKSKISGWRLTEDERTLVVSLEKELRTEDALYVDGVFDRAQRPNRMPAQWVSVKPPQWPSNRSGLVFVWQNGKNPGEPTYAIRARNEAFFDRNYGMVLSGGAYVVEGADGALLEAFRRSNAITVEATLTPRNFTQQGPARIITFSTDAGSRNFTLGQAGDRLVLRLRTPKTGTNGTSPEVTLCNVTVDEPNHIVVAYMPGRLVCYRNGERALDTDAVSGDFSNWSEQHLLFGDEWNGERLWQGTLEGIALYTRALDAAEAKANFDNYRSLLRVRPKRDPLAVQARLVARSDAPALEKIAPYRDALVIEEYDIVSVLTGHLNDRRIRVARWAILGGRTLTLAPSQTGGTTRLNLERLDANPQLQSIFLSDTLELSLDVPYFYAVY